MPNNNKTEAVCSDEVQEILSHVPNWMIRWGISFIFILIILLLFLSYLIKYPDVIEGQVLLTTEQPPSHLISQTNGYINRLFIPNDSTVREGDIIAEIRSPISKSSIDTLQKILTIQENDTLISQLGIVNNSTFASKIQAAFIRFFKFRYFLNC